MVLAGDTKVISYCTGGDRRGLGIPNYISLGVSLVEMGMWY